MTSLNRLRLVLGACVFAAVLGGCNGTTGSGQTSFVPSRTTRFISERGAASQDLLFISEYGGEVVDLFSYPQGTFLGYLSGLAGTPQGECVDKKGDVWIVEIGGHPTIQEFAHDGSGPIASLSDQGEHPYGCSVDPVTGNLAVSSEYGSTSFQGSVSIYKKAKGTPTVYIDQQIELMQWCGYDNKGNLFVDGLPPSNSKLGTLPAAKESAFGFAELPKGSHTFTNITLAGIKFPGNIQWDGTYVTVGDPAYKIGSAIYQVTVSGSQGTIVGKTVLKESDEVFQSWIQGDTVIGPDEGSGLSVVQLWKYPAGGKPTKALNKGSSMFFDGPFGAAVSAAK